MIRLLSINIGKIQPKEKHRMYVFTKLGINQRFFVIKHKIPAEVKPLITAKSVEFYKSSSSYWKLFFQFLKTLKTFKPTCCELYAAG